MSMKHTDSLKKIFENASTGKLTIYTPCDQELYFQGRECSLSCDVKIHDWSIIEMIKKRGDIGLGEAYHLGLWESSNLSNFLTYCCLNLSKLTKVVDGNFFNRMLLVFITSLFD